MKHIKKFSQLVTESTGRAAEIQEVVKKLGYNSLEEIKQEKALLTKLEGLMKELGKAGDVSEDEAEEIEDEVVAKGTPKSLVAKMGKKEEDDEPGAEEGVEEDTAEEIEDEKVKRGEPKGHSEEEGEEVVTRDQEVTSKVPSVSDDETQGTKVPKARIMTFEEFIRENEVTINKKVSYQDDEEEDEDNALPVAEADKDMNEAKGFKNTKNFEDFLEEIDNMSEFDVKKLMGKNYIDTPGFYQDEKDDYEDITDFMVSNMGRKEFEKLKDYWETNVQESDEYGIHVPLTMGNGSRTAASIANRVVSLGEPEDHDEEEGEVVVTSDQDITQKPKTSKDETDIQATVVVEAKVTSEKDFEEYAMKVLKKAHPDNFDQEVADKVVADLKTKYKGDFGAMVGALQSGMGK